MCLPRLGLQDHQLLARVLWLCCTLLWPLKRRCPDGDMMRLRSLTLSMMEPQLLQVVVADAATMRLPHTGAAAAVPALQFSADMPTRIPQPRWDTEAAHVLQLGGRSPARFAGTMQGAHGPRPRPEWLPGVDAAAWVPAVEYPVGEPAVVCWRSRIWPGLLSQVRPWLADALPTAPGRW